MRQKISNIIRYSKNYWELSANSLPMSTKQQIRINYIEAICMKIDAKKMKHYQISKKLL